jgi:hypothetical protein
MSEDALANYVDARSKQGDAAPEPSDESARELVGTVKLAEAALGTPAPSEEAERQSRERLVSQLEAAALTGRPLHDETPREGFFARLLRRFIGRG